MKWDLPLIKLRVVESRFFCGWRGAGFNNLFIFVNGGLRPLINVNEGPTPGGQLYLFRKTPIGLCLVRYSGATGRDLKKLSVSWLNLE